MESQIFMEILKSVSVGIIGILFYTLLKSTRYFVMWNPFKKKKTEKKSEWSFNKLAGENFGSWLWSLLMIIFIAVVAQIAPDSLDGVSDLTGLDVNGKVGSFFSLGFGLSIMIKETKKAIKNK